MGIETVGPRDNLGSLGPIADDALVEWLAERAGSGGAEEMASLASFARGATADAVLGLLSRLMRRIEGRAGADASVDYRRDDPWRDALVRVLKAQRLRDVPGAGEWLVKMLAKTEDQLTRESILDAMVVFPSAWSLLEAEALNGFEYRHRPRVAFLRAESAARALFRMKQNERPIRS